MVDKLNSTDVFVGGLEHLDGNFRAAGTINATELVEMDGTETGNMPDVISADSDGADGFGVAAHDASSGDAITVLMTGAHARTTADDPGGISPGDLLTSNGSSGTVGSVESTSTANDEIVGKALSSDDSNEVVMLIDTGGDAG